MSEKRESADSSSPEGTEPEPTVPPEPADAGAAAEPAEEPAGQPAEESAEEPADEPAAEAAAAEPGAAAEDAGPDGADGAPEPIVVGEPPRPRPRGRLGKVLMVCGVVALFAAGISAVGVYREYDRVVGHVKHVTVFGKTKNVAPQADRPDV